MSTSATPKKERNRAGFPVHAAKNGSPPGKARADYVVVGMTVFGDGQKTSVNVFGPYDTERTAIALGQVVYARGYRMMRGIEYFHDAATQWFKTDKPTKKTLSCIDQDGNFASFCMQVCLMRDWLVVEREAEKQD